MNDILLINTNNALAFDFFEKAKKTISAYENEYVKFDFKTVNLSDENLIAKAKSANAILFFTSDKQEELAIDSVRKQLGLYAQITTFSRRIDDVNHGFCIVQDKNGGIYEGEKSFANNAAFGREAYDVERYSELEIERTARIAYELANDSRRTLTLADKADKLTTSKLWRKIVADVNEDYPFVSVNMQDVLETIDAIISNPTSLGVVVTTALFGDILTQTAKSVASETPSVSYVCDTPLAMYGFVQTTAREIPSVESLIRFMLKNSFGIE